MPPRRRGSDRASVRGAPPNPLAESSRPRPVSPWLVLPTGVYLAFLALLTWVNAAGPERWWWSTINLYAPQAVWAVPGLLLAAASLRWGRRLLWLLGPALLWLAGPLMGFSLPLGRGSDAGRARLRVMTFNVKWGERGTSGLQGEILGARPDVLLCQDANGLPEEFLPGTLPGWTIRSAGQYVVASHLPLDEMELRTLPLPDGRWRYARCRLRVGGFSVTLYNVHFRTPRDAWTSIRYAGKKGIPGVEENARTRLWQAERIMEDTRAETGPVLIAGDLNAPMQSLVLRTLTTAGSRDAFSESGFGYGYTYGHTFRTRHSCVRIDHLMLSRHWQALRCWTGGAEASDHRPVIADLAL